MTSITAFTADDKVALVARIESALRRIELGNSIHRVPADPTDPDLVLAECKALLEQRWPPFWINEAPQAEPQQPEVEVDSDVRKALHRVLVLQGLHRDSPTYQRAIAAGRELLGLPADSSAQQPAGEYRALPERDVSMPAEQQGLFRKFDVRRTDGSDAPGGKHHGCRYFVLDVDHDPHAQAALTAYATSCESTHPALATDLRERWGAARAAPTQVDAGAEPATDFEIWRAREYPHLGPIGDCVGIAREAWDAALAAQDQKAAIAPSSDYTIVPRACPDSAFPWASGGYPVDIAAKFGDEKGSIHDDQHAKFARAVLQAVPSGRADAKPATEPPLSGRWHHGNGVLVSGGTRIARWDCDTAPPESYRDNVLDWVCSTLNAAVDVHKHADADKRDAELRWTHKFKGGSYRDIGAARIQTHTLLNDMDNVRVYAGDDGSIWVRGVTEFHQKFEQIDAALKKGGAA